MLREETVEPGTLELLKQITSFSEFSGFRLVGGTALALMLGHRKSIDLDLFTDQPFDKDYLKTFIEENFHSVVFMENRSAAILQGFINNIKTDFVSVKDPFKFPIQYLENVPFAHLQEIAALKLNAIKGRGSKKDFWDLSKLLNIYELKNLLKFYQERYPYDDTFAVMRSIVYFEDAEDEPDPIKIETISWEQVKQKIVVAFESYYKENL
ncbi:MAG: hypothetical protein K0S09_1347 [Sphingobacteriaceae bacterium]|jgi:hypothetical protein|nr:hypothetical protein [Sphingobacteriaceae bacterium]